MFILVITICLNLNVLQRNWSCSVKFRNKIGQSIEEYHFSRIKPFRCGEKMLLFISVESMGCLYYYCRAVKVRSKAM